LQWELCDTGIIRRISSSWLAGSLRPAALQFGSAEKTPDFLLKFEIFSRVNLIRR